jgi:hypothetical protein
MVRTLSIVIVVLALIDGLVHLSLNLFVTHGIVTRPPISVLFFLNFLGYLALIVAFLYVQQSSLSLRRLVDVVLIVYPLVTLVAWIYFTRGRGNPFGLAEISKPAEVILAVATVLHLVRLGTEEQPKLARAQT